jgi:hypothetical protein
MKNWKTTVVGALIGGLVAIQPLLAGGAVDIMQLVIGFAIAAFGAVSKDFDKTGV